MVCYKVNVTDDLCVCKVFKIYCGLLLTDKISSYKSFICVLTKLQYLKYTLSNIHFINVLN